VALLAATAPRVTAAATADDLWDPVKRRPLEAPSFECPEAGSRLPAGAKTAIAGFLGGDAKPICLGDLNGNGRPEVLAAVSERSFGRAMGFYWVTSKTGLFEEAPDRQAPWKPLLLTSDRIENARGVIGWKTPVDRKDGIGLRFTMTDGGRICLQMRRLDSNKRREEAPLVLVRWDPSVERYEEGRCPGGTAGTLRERRKGGAVPPVSSSSAPPTGSDR